MLLLKNYEQTNSFSTVSSDDLFFINGGSSNNPGSSMIQDGKKYMSIGTSCMSLGAKTGNIYLAGFGVSSAIVGAGETILGLLIQNNNGDIKKSMDRYYEHH